MGGCWAECPGRSNTAERWQGALGAGGLYRSAVPIRFPYISSWPMSETGYWTEQLFTRTQYGQFFVPVTTWFSMSCLYHSQSQASSNNAFSLQPLQFSSSPILSKERQTRDFFVLMQISLGFKNRERAAWDRGLRVYKEHYIWWTAVNQPAWQRLKNTSA